MTPLLEKEGKVKINNVLTFSSSLRRSTLAEVPGGGGGLLIQPLTKEQACWNIIWSNCLLTELKTLE
jgi:hypothetical protein